MQKLLSIQTSGKGFVFVISALFFIQILIFFLLRDLGQWIVILPILSALGFLAIYRPVFLFQLFVFSIPISIEFEFSNGLATDIPGEIFLWLLLPLTLIGLLKKGIPRELYGTTGMILSASLVWMFISVLFAEDLTVAAKSFFAKIWYVIPLVCFPLLFFNSEKDWQRTFNLFFCGLLIASSYFFLKHLSLGLDFNARGFAGSPVWRNHVNYASTLLVALPLCIYMLRSSGFVKRIVYLGILLLFLFFLYFSYTRLAYLCIVAMTFGYVVMRFQLFKMALVSGAFVLSVSAIWLMQKNRYLNFAPEYENTISQTGFNDLLIATYQKKDISSMERIHRWIAGLKMFSERPVTGFGPSNYFGSYKSYTVHSFSTYVSDNPDRSGVHNYFIMLAAEQGLPGLLLFILLLFNLLYKAEKLYFRNGGANIRAIAMSSFLLILCVACINSINDMIEVLKLGSIFYMSIAWLLWTDGLDRDEALIREALP